IISTSRKIFDSFTLPSRISARPTTTARRLLKSCATPAAISPSALRRSVCTICCCCVPSSCRGTPSSPSPPRSVDPHPGVGGEGGGEIAIAFRKGQNLVVHGLGKGQRPPGDALAIDE